MLTFIYGNSSIKVYRKSIIVICLGFLIWLGLAIGMYPNFSLETNQISDLGNNSTSFVYYCIAFIWLGLGLIPHDTFLYSQFKSKFLKVILIIKIACILALSIITPRLNYAIHTSLAGLIFSSIIAQVISLNVLMKQQVWRKSLIIVYLIFYIFLIFMIGFLGIPSLIQFIHGNHETPKHWPLLEWLFLFHCLVWQCCIFWLIHK